MKRILSVILALLMIIPLCVFGVTAQEAEETTEECTSSGKNIASEASVGYVGTHFWAIDGSLLVDGNKDAVAHSAVYSFSWQLKFGSLKEINKVALYVNGSGDCRKCGYSHTADASSCIKSLKIKLYDDTGKAVYESQTVSLLDKTDPDNPIIGTEAIFDIPDLKISTVEIFVDTDSWGSGYFREAEVYQVTGEHAWELDEEESWPASCQDTGENVYKCSCGASKTEAVNAHTVEDWEVVLAPTTLESGVAEGKCTVPGCDGYGSKILPRLSLTDNEKKIGLSNVSIIEDIKEELGTTNNTRYPNPNRNAEALFDGIIDTEAYNPTNFWCGTGWQEKVVLVPDDPNTPEDETEYEIITPDNPETEADETVYKYNYYYSTLTINLDQVYSLTQAELYVYSNWNNFVIDFIGEDGTPVKSITKANYQNDTFTRLIFTGDVYGLDVKSIVITVQSAKWEGGRGLAFTELKLTAHECSFSEDSIENKTVDKCTTTFDGTCSRCTKKRTNVTIVEHTYEKDEQNPSEDKIVEVMSEALCYRNGKVKKHCSACSQDVIVVTEPTGNHEYGDTQVQTKPTCGTVGYGYKECTVEGCKSRTETLELPPEGSHSYKWVEQEGFEADYTHDGIKINKCSVCSDIDEESGTQVSKKIDPKFVSAKDWSVRYTDFTSPKATFKVSKSLIERDSEQFDVKIYGVVKKGDVTKEVQVYGEGATGVMQKDGTFSLVVKGGSYSDEYEFSVKVVITDKQDGTSVTAITKSKPLTSSPDGVVSAADVAYYFINNESKANSLDESVKTLYEQIAAARK